MPDIAQHLGMDAFDVRDLLVRRGALAALVPEEAKSLRSVVTGVVRRYIR